MARPSLWTCIVSSIAFSLEWPNSFRSTQATYEIRFTGSFHTTTFQMSSRSVASSVSGSMTGACGAVVTIAMVSVRQDREEAAKIIFQPDLHMKYVVGRRVGTGASLSLIHI